MIAAIVLSFALAAGAQEASPQKERPSLEKSAKASAMTGCVDQRDNRYFLMGEKRKGETWLKGQAFTDDNFARFVGHKVSVQGQLKEDTFHVTRIEKIAETCH